MTKKIAKTVGIPMKRYIGDKNFMRDKNMLTKEANSLEEKYKDIQIRKIANYQKLLQQSATDAKRTEIDLNEKDLENIHNESFKLNEDERKVFDTWQSAQALSDAFDKTLVTQALSGIQNSKSHSSSASALRKLEQSQISTIIKRYIHMVTSGEKHGAIKALAAEFDVHRNTINRVLKEHNAK